MKIWIVFVGLVSIIFVPLFSIWSINTLFLQDIPYNMLTWLASMWLTLLVINRKTKKTTADQTAKLATLNKELAAIRASISKTLADSEAKYKDLTHRNN